MAKNTSRQKILPLHITYITSPKEDIRAYLFWDYLKPNLYIFGDGPINDAHHK
jgi:hypothetical protein